MKREDPAVTALRASMLAHLDTVADSDERRALTQELQSYFYRYTFSVKEIPRRLLPAGRCLRPAKSR